MLPVTLSVLYATILLCGLALIEISPLSRWSELSASDKRWIFCASFYAIVLTVSGFLYAALEWRGSGITHALLMLGLAVMVAYKVLHGLIASPGPDNAAAGILAAANLAFVVAGAIAAVCGIAVLRRLFSCKREPTQARGQ